MEVFLLVTYSILFLTFIYKSQRFKTDVISSTQWILLATVKIIVALAYFWLHKSIPTFFDSTYYVKEANIIYSSLNESPLYYLQLTFGFNNHFPEPEHLCIYIDQMGLWYDYTAYTIVRINAIFRLISFGYISVHFLFFSFLSFIGAFYLFKFFERVTDISEYIILLVLFFVPSVIFWTSGLHKEALVLLCVGIVTYNLYMLTINKSKLRIAWLILFSLFLFNIRIFLLAIFVPTFIAYYWNERNQKIKAYVPYIVTFGITITGTLLYDSIIPNEYRIASKITESQNSFLKSLGNTSFTIDNISNSWRNIITSFPESIFNSFWYPVYNDCISNWCKLASFESTLFMILVIIGIIKIKYRYLMNNNVALFCLGIGISWMSIIGIVVNNAGAIVRYRSIAIIFILIGLIVASQKRTKFSN